MDLKVDSELGRLREVAIHTPGPELDRMTPQNIEAWVHDGDGAVVSNRDYLLFDDLVLLSRLRHEHQQIGRVLQATCGRQRTHELRDLLRTVLHDEEARKTIVDAVVHLERTVWDHTITGADRDVILGLDPHNLLKTLIRGTLPDGRGVLAWPLPNLMFTRDLGCVVGGSVLMTFARKPARHREMLLGRAIFRFHPRLRDAPALDIRETVANPAIEGGDILVVSDHQVVIGIGERTTEESALAAARQLLEHEADTVYLVELDVARSTMHLDTVFTLADKDRCLVFAPQILDSNAAAVRSLEKGAEIRRRKGSLLDVLKEDGLTLSPIPCGGDDPAHQTREQWSDGANAFALAPGRILLYGRNEHTLRRLNAEGFEVLTPDEFCRNATLLLTAEDRRVVVSIDGSELSRGRGGPRCLTLPLVRDSV